MVINKINITKLVLGRLISTNCISRASYFGASCPAFNAVWLFIREKIRPVLSKTKDTGINGKFLLGRDRDLFWHSRKPCSYVKPIFYWCEFVRKLERFLLVRSEFFRQPILTNHIHRLLQYPK